MEVVAIEGLFTALRCDLMYQNSADDYIWR